jgi:ABC-2 type transport system ATP-binding protein
MFVGRSIPDMPDNHAIEAVGLAKSYGATKVLDGVDLAVPPGSVLSLLGPNGAGKTTTVRILATLTGLDGGRARVAGHDVVRQRREVRRRISLTGQHTAVDEPQTGEENLRMIGRLAGLGRTAARQRALELLDEFELGDVAGRRVATYSGGLRRRLDLAASLVGRPEVIFLDEPTTGLDPRSRLAAWRMIAGLAGSGVTVLLTTQYLEEADRLADRIAVLDGGRVVADGSPAELKARVGDQRLDLEFADRDAFEAAVLRLGARVIRRDESRRSVGVATDGSAAQVRGLLDEVDPDRGRLTRFAMNAPTLDDVFLALTGHPTGAGEDRSEREAAGV